MDKNVLNKNEQWHNEQCKNSHIDAGGFNASTDRIKRLRNRIMSAPMEVSLIRARKFTEARQKFASMPLVIQRALALKDTLEYTPTVILEDELIAGHMTEKLKGAVVYPEVRAEWLQKELKALDKRFTHRFVISSEESEELEEIAGQWLGNTAFEHMINNLEPDVRKMRENVIITDTAFGFGLHLFYPDMKKVLTVGLDGMLKDIQEHANKISSDEQDRSTFYQAMEITITAFQNWIMGYAIEAESQAERKQGIRADELNQIAEVMKHIAHKPPATFHEGLQMVYLVHLMLDLADGGHEIPYGRLDQLLYPLYESDMKSGNADSGRIRELIEAFFIQSSTITHFMENAFTLAVDGNTGRLDVTIGGIDETGQDVTNELSYLFLSIINDLKTIQPNVMVRLHRQTPQDFFELVTKVMTGGSNVVAVFNDETIIESLTSRGISIEDAREYIIGGCVSPIPRGTYGPLCGSHVFMTKVFERVFMNAMAYSSYEEFYRAFKDELSSAIASLSEMVRVADSVHREFLQQPMVSAFVEGPLERGMDVKIRGGRNNLTGMNFIGFATIVDSLAALKEMVFDSSSLSLEQVVKAAGSNFKENEKIRQILLNKANKFGNDNDAVDGMAHDLWDFIDSEVKKHRTFRKGQFVPGMISATLYMLAGFVSPATPDGRMAKMPVSIGGSPVNGASRSGPTAALKSVTAVNLIKAPAGVSVNMRFNPAIFRSKEQLVRFEDMVKTYFFDLGGQHLQLNVVDTDILKHAKSKPEMYSDLMVRVAGYSAQFTDLSPMTQDEIIARTEYDRL